MRRARVRVESNRRLFYKNRFHAISTRSVTSPFATQPTPTQHFNPHPVTVVILNRPHVSKADPDFQALICSRCPKVSTFRRGLLKHATAAPTACGSQGSQGTPPRRSEMFCRGNVANVSCYTISECVGGAYEVGSGAGGVKLSKRS